MRKNVCRIGLQIGGDTTRRFRSRRDHGVAGAEKQGTGVAQTDGPCRTRPCGRSPGSGINPGRRIQTLPKDPKLAAGGASNHQHHLRGISDQILSNFSPVCVSKPASLLGGCLTPCRVPRLRRGFFLRRDQRGLPQRGGTPGRTCRSGGAGTLRRLQTRRKRNDEFSLVRSPRIAGHLFCPPDLGSPHARRRHHPQARDLPVRRFG